MTILNALKNSVNYPLKNDNVEPLLITRGLDPNGDFVQSVGISKPYRLAYADTLRFVATMVNLSQGGSVSQAAVKELIGTANTIYKKYGEPLIGESSENKSVIRDISHMW